MKNKSFDSRRPATSDEFDDSGAAYGVNVTDGFINVEQESQRYGKDVVSAMDPEDARWLARQLLEAATVAETHERYTPGTCRASIAAPFGPCLFGTEGCITHPSRKKEARVRS